ncbi:hypothetical protein [Microvirga antarctica]|uniref:hypothetical protein n=1 Tax=Microvirga antarctica TaxID=2819233 RepID=UPI001B30BF01|nr:hypothetical protein [Microvirga antarctica]
MRFVRRVLGHRAAGGFAAAAFAYLLMFQGLAGALAQGRVVGLPMDVGTLCIPSADPAAGPAAPGDGERHTLCAIVCQLSGAHVAALPAHAPTFGIQRAPQASWPARLVTAPATRHLPLHVAEARAPPRIG